jgi:hypothetical protein
MGNVVFPEIVKENINIDFMDVMKASKAFSKVIGSSKLESIWVENVRYIMTPKMSRVINRFRIILYSLPYYRSGRILTIDDLNSYDLIKVDKAIFNIHFRGGTFSSFVIYTKECNEIVELSYIHDDLIKSLPKHYDFLYSITPYELKYMDHNDYSSVDYSSIELILASTTILTFLYNVYEHFDEIEFSTFTNACPNNKCGINYQQKVEEFKRELKRRIEGLGDNFEEGFRSLVFIGALM